MGVGARVKALVLERLRANAERGVVGRWQEVCILPFPAELHTYPSSVMTIEARNADDQGRDHRP